MFDFAGDFGLVLSLAFLVVTGFIAVKGVNHRDENGNLDFVRLLFGCVAAVFFLIVLLDDVLGVMKF